MKIQHSIIIAAIIIGVAIVLSAFINRLSGGSRYKYCDGLILDTRTGDVQRAADKLNSADVFTLDELNNTNPKGEAK